MYENVPILTVCTLKSSRLSENIYLVRLLLLLLLLSSPFLYVFRGVKSMSFTVLLNIICGVQRFSWDSFFFIIFKHFMCTTNHTTHKQSRRDSWYINVRNNNVIQCSIQIYAFFIHVTHVLYRFALMLID